MLGFSTLVETRYAPMTGNIAIFWVKMIIL